MRFLNILLTLSLFTQSSCSLKENSKVSHVAFPQPEYSNQDNNSPNKNIDLDNSLYNLKDKMPYIPWNFVNDGCWARAEYISAELALKGISSGSVNAITCDTKKGDLEHGLQGPNGVKWYAHVAPIVKTSDSQFVIDPGFSDSPMSIQEWEQSMGSVRMSHIIDHVGKYQQTLPDDLACLETREKSLVPETTAQMRKFSAENFLTHCQYFKRFWLDLENSNRATIEERVKAFTALDNRIKYLSEELSKLDLWDGDIIQECGEPIPAK